MSMLCLAAYNSEGRIGVTVCGPEETALQSLRLNTQEPYVETPPGVTTDRYYIENKELKERPEGTARLDGLTLKGVLAGSKVTIEGIDYTADGTDIDLEFSLPGSYMVVVELWPYKKQEFVVENKT